MPHNEKKELVMEHFNRVYDSTFDSVRRFTASKCADVESLPDLLQEIYFEYYKLVCRKGTDYVKEPAAMLIKIAKHKLAAHYSLKNRLSALLPLSVDEDGESDPPDPLADTEEAVLDKDEAERIWDLLSEYPADVRKVFYLHYAEDMPLKEIARAMGLSLSSVKNKLYRTLNEIRERSENDV